MIWLFPLYLLGGAAVLGPIVLHLRRKPPQEQVAFSSLMFLEAQTPQPTKRRRMEHWLLLLLRCLALLLLALMFARPLWTQPIVTVVDQPATLLLLDRSASMRREDLWSRAVTQTLQRLAQAAPEERWAVMLFDREPRLLWSFEDDARAAGRRRVEVESRLKEVEPGWAGTNLGRALAEAVAILQSSPGLHGRAHRVVLLSDLQEGADLESLRGLAWPESVGVELAGLTAASEGNMTLSPAAALASSGEAGRQSTTAIRVRVANARNSKNTDYQIAWERGGGELVSGHLPPGAARVLPAPPAAQPEQASVLRLSGDVWDFDNRVYIAPPQPTSVRIGWLRAESGRDEAASPLFYLARALQSTAALEPVLERRAAGSLDGLHVAILGGGSEGDLQAQRAWLESGGFGIWPLDPLTRAADVEKLTGVTGIDCREAVIDDYRMLSEVDTAHPLLRVLADPRLRDFTKLRFWHHRTLKLTDAAAQKWDMIARYDNGDPAMLSCQVGRGKVLLLTSGWHPADSQLALSTKFVPLLYGWLEAAGFRYEAENSLWVGDALPSGEGVEIETPAGKVLKPKAGEKVHADRPGLFVVRQKEAKPQWLAVNLPVEEGRVAPLAPERLKELGVRLETEHPAGAVAGAATAERLAFSEQEARQRAWAWLLLGLLGVLAMETWVAGRYRKGQLQSTVATG